MTTTDLLAPTTWVTDGGLETDLVFHRGIDLPEFASFPLVETPEGVDVLRAYYRDYLAIAGAAGAGVLLETPTWRSNPDWGRVLGYDAAALDRVNRASVALVRGLAADASGPALVSGAIGPRGDGYLAGGTDPDEAQAYHRAQVESFAAAGVDLVHALTMTGVAEAVGVVRAARAVGLPVAISFTVETDGRLPDGTTLAAALDRTDELAPADWYGVNCAHPTHLVPALDDDAARRLTYFRPNASTMSHAELDEMEVLDAGDLDLLASGTAAVRERLADARVIGGCCGTDATHVARLWDVDLEQARAAAR